jgi:hypothetical protein
VITPTGKTLAMPVAKTSQNKLQLRKPMRNSNNNLVQNEFTLERQPYFKNIIG